MKKGFTLIELLIVIAILGVLAAVTMVGIDPIDKINAANDSKVQSDISSIATAMESYAVSSSGNIYATDQLTLVNNGDLKMQLIPPTGYSYTVEGGGLTGKVYSPLKSKKYRNTPFWVWCSASGKAGAILSSSNCP